MKLEDLPAEFSKGGLEKIGAKKIEGFGDYLQLEINGWKVIYEPMERKSQTYVLRNAIPLRDENKSKSSPQ